MKVQGDCLLSERHDKLRESMFKVYGIRSLEYAVRVVKSHRRVIRENKLIQSYLNIRLACRVEKI